MHISVIFSTYRRHELLEDTLTSFCSLNTDSIDWETIVVDNASDARTNEIVESYAGKLPVKYITEKKKGKNNALNTAIDSAKGELFLFTDDDVLADDNWLVKMWEGSREWGNASVFGGRILPNFPRAGVPISREHPFFKGAYVVADWDIGEGPYEAKHVWGPNMAVRANVFQDGWRFDPNIGPHGNNYVMGSETEFTIRLERAGITPVYLPKALVYHQIRPEQLKAKWLYGRAFRYGRSEASMAGNPDVPFAFDIPRYLFRTLLNAWLKKILCAYDRSKRVSFGIEVWRIIGNMYQYKVLRS
jgi:glycosyltransferase involved in cell wall biosynthesis